MPNNKVVEHRYINQRKRLFDPLGNLNVGL
jgi:hypothetical protein